MLATSRRGPGLPGERMVAVPALGVPSEGTDIGKVIAAEAVQLFRIERSQSDSR